MPDTNGNNRVGIEITGKLADDFRQAIEQARSLLQQLQAEASVGIGGSFRGGAGGGGGANQSIRGAGGAAAGVLRSVQASNPALIGRMDVPGGGSYIPPRTGTYAGSTIGGAVGLLPPPYRPDFTMGMGGGGVPPSNGGPDWVFGSGGGGAGFPPGGGGGGGGRAIPPASGGSGALVPYVSPNAGTAPVTDTQTYGVGGDFRGPWRFPWGNAGGPGVGAGPGVTTDGSNGTFVNWRGSDSSPNFGRMGMGFARGGAMALGRYAEYAANAGVQEIMTGRPDHMGATQANGELIGGLIGAGLGALTGNPWLSMSGAYFGGQAGGSIARLFDAPSQLQLQTSTSLLEMGRVRAGLFGQYGVSDMGPIPGADGNGPKDPFGFANRLVGSMPTRRMVPNSILGAKDLSDWINGAGSGEGSLHRVGLLEQIRAMYGDEFADYAPGAKEVSAAYNAIGSGILSAGYDPTMGFGDEDEYESRNVITGYHMEKTGRKVRRRRSGGTFASRFGGGADQAAFKANALGAGKGMVGRLAAAAGYAIEGAPWSDSEMVDEEVSVPTYGRVAVPTGRSHGTELAKFLIENLAFKTGLSVDEAGKTLNPLLNFALSHTNQQNFLQNGAGAFSAADLLQKFGPESTSLLYEAFTKPGVAPLVSMQQLRQAQYGMTQASTAEERAALAIRGGGRQAFAADMDERDAILSLPGSGNSLALARNNQKLRSSLLDIYSEDDATGYSMDEMRLKNRRIRQDASPFSPGDRYRTELQSIAMNRNRIGVLQGREREMRGAGLLSAQDEFSLESQIEQLTTQNYVSLAHLSEGAENRIPAMTAGGIAGTSRFDSMQLAALNLGAIGSLSGRFGFLNGAAAHQHDKRISDMLGGPLPGPTSSTSAINAPLGGGTAQLDAIVRLLQQLVDESRGSKQSQPYRGSGYPGQGGDNRGRMATNY